MDFDYLTVIQAFPSTPTSIWSYKNSKVDTDE